MQKNVTNKRPAGFYAACIAFSFERFAFYAAKWLMTVFVAATIMDGGLGLSTGEAARMSANLVAFTYLLPLFGGYISDYLIGARYLIPIGLALMGVGYLLAWKAESAGAINAMVILVSIGTGLFKSQNNAIIGRLFKDKTQLDAAYSTQYSFVNIGSFIGTTIIGILAAKYGYRFCFLVCAIIVFIDAIWYIANYKNFGNAGKKPFKINENADPNEVKNEEKVPLTKLEKNRIFAIILVSFFSIIFWIFWYLASLPVLFHWAGETAAADWTIGSFEVPTAWFDSLNAILCIILGPILGAYWTKKANSPKGDFNMFQKTALGIFLLGLSYIVFGSAEIARGTGQASLVWIIVFGILLTLGEMVFSPLGNSFIAKYAPPQLITTMMSVWVLAVFFSGKSYGAIYDFTQQFPFDKVMFTIAAIAIISAAILWFFSGKLQRLVEPDAADRAEYEKLHNTEKKENINKKSIETEETITFESDDENN